MARMEKKKQVALCFSVIRGHIPQFFPLDTMGFLEASAHGRSGLTTLVAKFGGGPSPSALTFLSLGELYSEGQRKGELLFPSLPSQPLSLPVAGVVIKGEVHTEVKPKGPVPFPDVLGELQKKCGHVEGRARAGLCVIKGTGWGGAGGGGEFFALLRI